jgi:hypothetical protein
MNTVQELRWCDERVYMFQCLVMYISLDKIYYVHPGQARYINRYGIHEWPELAKTHLNRANPS